MQQSGASRLTQAASDRQSRKPTKKKRPVAWKYDSGKGKYYPADYKDWNEYSVAESDERGTLWNSVSGRTPPKKKR